MVMVCSHPPPVLNPFYSFAWRNDQDHNCCDAEKNSRILDYRSRVCSILRELGLTDRNFNNQSLFTFPVVYPNIPYRGFTGNAFYVGLSFATSGRYV